MYVAPWLWTSFEAWLTVMLVGIGYYCSEQDEEDVLLFKNYDSARSVLASTVLHTGTFLQLEVCVLLDCADPWDSSL